MSGHIPAEEAAELFWNGDSMSEAAERGPNYDWKHEAEHYRDECDKLRNLLHQVESSSERDIYGLKEEVRLLRCERDYLYGDLIGTEHRLGLKSEMLETKYTNLHEEFKLFLDYVDHCADFRNGVEFQGIDEGDSYASKYIERAKRALFGEKLHD